MSTESKEPINKEVHQYDVEMNNLMSIIINSMYSSKEYFMRELISNASDACDKLNEMRLSLDRDVELDGSLRIDISFTENELVIADNGIGMKKDELVSFLGCVAKSGTKSFREALKNKKSADDLIGQFGLGFYSSFLVADRVDVISRYPGEEKTYKWSSTGMGQYSVEEVENGMVHGTRIVLQLKDGCKEFGKKERIVELVKKYSMFILHPIMINYFKPIKVDDKVDGEEVKVDGDKVEDLNNSKEGDKVEDLNNSKIEENNDNNKIEENNDNNKIEENNDNNKIKENENKMEEVCERINKDKPLWSMNPKEISREMYTSFYKTISNDWDDYLAVKHSHLEGSVSLDILLFAPKRPRFNMFMEKQKKNNNIKLYCNSVFVTDELELPDWMQCVVGVISSRDIPINVSREFMQGGNVKKMIKKNLIKKTVELLKEMSAETYKEYYKEFSSAIKLAVRDEGVLEDLLLFCSNKRDSLSLAEYARDMKEGQDKVYIITGTNREEVVNSPFVEMFSDYEVIFMIDAIDEYLLQKLRKYREYDIVKINQEGVELPNSTISKEMEEQLSTLKERIEKILSEQVEKVEFKDLKGKHMMVQTPKHSISPAMEKILAAQVSIDKSNMFMFPKGKKILKVNVNHPLTFRMNALVEREKEFSDLVWLLFRVSCVECGYALEDPVGFSAMVISALVDCGDKKGNDEKDSKKDNIDEKDSKKDSIDEKDNIDEKVVEEIS